MDKVWKISNVNLNDQLTLKKVNNLLKSVNLTPDTIDECAVICDEAENIIATISRYLNTIKCLAINPDYQGNNIANKLVTYMIQHIYQNGWNEVFVFTKPNYFKVFQQLGFNIIYQNETFAFLTNRFDLFQNYLNYLVSVKVSAANSSVIVMNANPFTNGHLHLVKVASEQSDFVYIIPVREEGSLFSYQERLAMIQAGVQELANVKVLAGSNYLVSKKVFPSYFLPSSLAVIKEQTTLDAHIFSNYVAKALNVQTRFVGHEPYSPTTNQYNEMMKTIFHTTNLNLVVVPRLAFKQAPISATLARKLFINGDFTKLKAIVPKTTLDFLQQLDYLSYQQLANISKLVDKDY